MILKYIYIVQRNLHLRNIKNFLSNVGYYYQPPYVLVIKDENIGNYGYIGTSILRIYQIYQKYIGGYSGKRYR